MTHPHVLAEVDTTRCRELRGDLSARLALCSRDELRVISVLLGRLELGRSRYGYLDLDRDARDFARERAEEYVDLGIYDACDYLDKLNRLDQLEIAARGTTCRCADVPVAELGEDAHRVGCSRGAARPDESPDTDDVVAQTREGEPR